MTVQQTAVVILVFSFLGFIAGVQVEKYWERQQALADIASEVKEFDEELSKKFQQLPQIPLLPPSEFWKEQNNDQTRPPDKDGLLNLVE